MSPRRQSKPTGRLAIYPGTFDPVTNGHVSLVERALGLFDTIVVAVASNVSKKCLFTFDERISIARKVFDKFPRVEVSENAGLTAEYAKTRGACAIVRGIRAVSDFEFEFQMALMNRKMARDIETVFLMPSLSWVYLSSTLVKDVAVHGGDVSTLVPAAVNSALKKKLRNL